MNQTEPKLITIVNAGKKIKETDYWDGHAAVAGRFWFSLNAGCIRMLLPDNQHHLIGEFKTGKKIILSRGAWPQMAKDDGFEIMFEDYSDTPFCLHVGTDQWDFVPEKKSVGRHWDFAIWTRQRCILQKKCYYRLVDSIPYMKPWGK